MTSKLVQKYYQKNIFKNQVQTYSTYDCTLQIEINAVIMLSYMVVNSIFMHLWLRMISLEIDSEEIYILISN